VDADFPTSRISDDISQLKRALQKAADSILTTNNKLTAAGDSNLGTELHAVLGSTLRLVSPIERSKPAARERLEKVVLKSHLLHALQRLVWGRSSEAGCFGLLRPYLLWAVPALQLRDAVWSNAEYMKPAWQDSSSSSSGQAPKEHQACNKLLDAQRQLSLWWYSKLKGAQGSSSSTDAAGILAAPGSLLYAALQPRMGELMQCLQLPSLSKAAAAPGSGCDPAGCILQLVAAAVLLRLCAEAAHPCLIITAKAGSAGHTEQQQFGGLESSNFVYAPAKQEGAAAQRARVIGCVLPGVVYDAGLMLIHGGECGSLQPVRTEEAVMVG
jgi:hypothetical protein